MSTTFRLTPQAASDAEAIWAYLANAAGEATADRMLAKLFDGCTFIAAMPTAGHTRERDAPDDVRFWRVHPYQLVYRWQTRPVQIIAIVHGARDMPRSLIGRV